MCGQWIFAGSNPEQNETPLLNNTIRKFYNLALENRDSNWINFYYNYLNAVESIESGYLHSIVVDEGDVDNQIAYLEKPHGEAQEDDSYERRSWICSNDIAFMHDVIQMRDGFCSRHNIISQNVINAHEKIVERTIPMDEYYRETKGWGFMSRKEFEECRRHWENNDLPRPRPNITPYYEPNDSV